MPKKLPEFRYQIVVTAYKKEIGEAAFYSTINGHSLIEVLSRLPLEVASLIKLEEVEKSRYYVGEDDDIPF